ncbi:Glycosyl transferase, family 2 [Nitrospira japonica]|uniref:dolichyl-phosphate beta-glucosyltransferase n=1 Tax=Nitrospira japonica TaxID=1325564 RepID=A0A1W1I040_9BACT|nr:dolichyl-phosphate beta-glucosyltransferase [Nitrospira japonica]SLM46342.1 Glycosyl transferase, family 2 [Nitrospira japonica]
MHHSIIIPAYNEAGRILPYLRRITDYMRGRGNPYEILVVDDGSTDATPSVVDGLSACIPEISLLRLPGRRGKGAAVKRGMQAATGQLQLFADADGATPIEELARLEQALETGAHLAIGSRALASRLPEFSVRAKLYRTILGGLFNAAVRQGGIRNISDTQCGFKLFRRTVAQDLFGVATIEGYGLDLELLYVAQRRGYRIAEVPINWTDQPGSKVRVWRDGLLMMRELARVRQNDRKGLYHTAAFAESLAANPSRRLGLPLN